MQRASERGDELLADQKRAADRTPPPEAALEPHHGYGCLASPEAAGGLATAGWELLRKVPARRSGTPEGRFAAALTPEANLVARQGSQSPAEGVGTSGGGEGCDTDEGTSAANGGRKRAHEGTPDEEGSEAEGAPSSSSGRRAGSGARRAKRPRLVWTMELNKRFLDAVMHLGISQAVPKAILALMNVEGMTRENVASHLQKYRIWLKRLAGYPPGARVSPDMLQQVAEQQMHQALLFPGLASQPAAGPAAHFPSPCFPLSGAVSAPEAQLAPVPLQAAATGNGNAHRAGFTYPTTWLGTLPQIPPLSGVSTGAAAPALGLPQLGFLGAPAPVGPGAHAPGGWVWGVASSDALPARAPAAAPTPVDRRCLAGVGAVGAAGSVAAGPVSNSCAALPAGQVMSAGDASVAAGQPAAEPAATVAAGPPRHAHA